MKINNERSKLLSKTLKVVLLLLFIVTLKSSSVTKVYGEALPKLSNEIMPIVDDVETNVEELIEEGEEENEPTQSLLERQLRLSSEQELVIDGWSKINRFEEGRIPLKSGDYFSYFFGSHSFFGRPVGSLERPNRGTPNAEIVTERGKRVGHIHNAGSHLQTSTNLFWGTGTATNLGVPSAVWKDYAYYKKEIDGFPAYKMIYYPDGYMRGSQFTRGQFAVEVTLVGRPRGVVEVTQQVKNISNLNFDNFILAQAIDTNVNGNDQVPIKLIGNKKGMYIESGDYRLDYDFSVGNPPDNWVGGIWNNMRLDWNQQTNQNTVRNTRYIAPVGGNQRAFSGIVSPGWEIDDREAGTAPLGTKISDTAIYMKNQPISLRSGEETGFSYLIKIARLTAITVNLDKENETINPNEDYTITGNWSDVGADDVDLYYQIDNGIPVKFADKLANVDPGKSYNFSHRIPKEELSSGKHKITIIGINDEELEDKATLNLNVKSELTVQYKDLDGVDIHPQEKSYGLVGSAYKKKAVDLLPLYELDHVEGGTANANNEVAGQYTNTAKVITFYYKAIPQEVDLTVKFLNVNGDGPLKDIVTGVVVPDERISNLVIGSQFDPNVYKKEFSGYEFVELVNTSGSTVPDLDFTIIFKYKGGLGIQDVTPTIDFGTNDLITSGAREIRPLNDTTMTIMDTRESAIDWELSLNLVDEIKNQAGDVFHGEVRFRDKNNQDMVITQSKSLVQTRETQHHGIASFTWNKDNQGVYLKQLPGNKKGEYSGKMIWNLTDGL